MSRLDSFYEGGPRTFEEAFPPVCVSSHWDPTQVSRHVLPTHLSGSLQFDPRQSVKVCTSYYELPTNPNTAPVVHNLDKIIPDSSMETPSAKLLGPEYYQRPYDHTEMIANPPGGAAGLGAPYSEYSKSINTESDLYRLDEPLTKCKEQRYHPAGGPKDATNTLAHVSQEFGLSPYAMYVNATTGCRASDDDGAWNRSGRLFFNHTRLDRVYPREHGPLVCGTKVQ